MSTDTPFRRAQIAENAAYMERLRERRALEKELRDKFAASDIIISGPRISIWADGERTSKPGEPWRFLANVNASVLEIRRK